MHLEVSRGLPPAELASPAWSYHYETVRPVLRYDLHRLPRGWRLQVLSVAQPTWGFEFDRQRLRFDGPADFAAAERHLHAMVLPLWLEWQGVPCLHANVIAWRGAAYLLLAASGVGKSTLSVALQQQGATLLADDMAALHAASVGWKVFYGPSRLHLCSDALEQLHGSCKTDGRLDAVGSTQAGGTSKKHRLLLEQPAGSPPFLGLRACYVLERLPSPASSAGEAQRLHGAEALLSLLDHSVAGDASRVLGQEAKRFATLARMAKTVPVFRWRYASGFAQLADAAQRLTQHLDSLQHET